MKRITVIILALVLCLICVFVQAEGGPNLLTVQEWLDQKGECGNCFLLAVVTKITTPMQALVCDETAACNLFIAVDEAGLREGDIILMHNPGYNEYEGSVEIAFPEIVRHIHLDEAVARVDAQTYEFMASPDEQIFINNQIFSEEVTVSGEGQNVNFINCEFRANIVSTCAATTQVVISPDCQFAEGAHCILRSGVREADMAYPLPKFTLGLPVEVECPDIGGVIAMDVFDIVFNGQTYAIGDAMHVETADGQILENDGSIQCQIHVVGHWWENGEEIIYTLGAE